MMNIITAADARQMVYEKQHQAPMPGELEKVLIDRILDEIYAAASRGEESLKMSLPPELDSGEWVSISWFLGLLGFVVLTSSRDLMKVEISWEEKRNESICGNR